MRRQAGRGRWPQPPNPGPSGAPSTYPFLVEPPNTYIGARRGHDLCSTNVQYDFDALSCLSFPTCVMKGYFDDASPRV